MLSPASAICPSFLVIAFDLATTVAFAESKRNLLPSAPVAAADLASADFFDSASRAFTAGASFTFVSSFFRCSALDSPSAGFCFLALFNGCFFSAIVPPFPATAPRSVSSAEREQSTTPLQDRPKMHYQICCVRICIRNAVSSISLRAHAPRRWPLLDWKAAPAIRSVTIVSPCYLQSRVPNTPLILCNSAAAPAIRNAHVEID